MRWRQVGQQPSRHPRGMKNTLWLIVLAQLMAVLALSSHPLWRDYCPLSKANLPLECLGRMTSRTSGKEHGEMPRKTAGRFSFPLFSNRLILLNPATSLRGAKDFSLSIRAPASIGCQNGALSETILVQARWLLRGFAANGCDCS
jgi:hypothetical protein